MQLLFSSRTPNFWASRTGGFGLILKVSFETHHLFCTWVKLNIETTASCCNDAMQFWLCNGARCIRQQYRLQSRGLPTPMLFHPVTHWLRDTFQIWWGLLYLTQRYLQEILNDVDGMQEVDGIGLLSKIWSTDTLWYVHQKCNTEIVGWLLVSILTSNSVIMPLWWKVSFVVPCLSPISCFFGIMSSSKHFVTICLDWQTLTAPILDALEMFRIS